MAHIQSLSRVVVRALTGVLGLGCSILASCGGTIDGADGRSSAEPIIFGFDTQFEWLEVTTNLPELRTSASAVGFYMNTAEIFCDQGTCGIAVQPSNLCTYDAVNYAAEFRLAQEPQAVGCTAFLVAPDLVATAGHCIIGTPEAPDCVDASVVFGYASNSTRDAYLPISETNVYRCAEVIQSPYVTLGPEVDDWAILRLDRPVADRPPLWIRHTGKIEDNAEMFLAGYPSGMPFKLDIGDNEDAVRDNSDPNVFTHAFDSFHGSSGAPVMRASDPVTQAYPASPTGVVEGMHIQGPGIPDYILDTSGCYLFTRCEYDTGCFNAFAKALRTTVFHQYVPLVPAGIVAVTQIVQ